jgi:hypothetical protein
VYLFPAERDGDVDSLVRASPDAAGQFAITGVHPGQYRVHVYAFGPYVASLVSGTTDLSKGAELVIEPGTPPEPLEIVLRDDSASIAGTIDESAKIADGVWALLAPAAGGEAERAMVYLGKFEFQNLAPGDYQVYLFKNLDNIEYRNPDVMRTFKGGETVHVTAGGKATVMLKVAQ